MDIFERIFRTAGQELATKVAFDAMETALGLVFKGGLCVAFGPVGLFVPTDKLVSWGIEIGYNTYRRLSDQEVVGTSYHVRRTSSGLFEATNTNPASLSSLPIELPEYYTFSDNLLIPESSPVDYYFLNTNDTDAVYSSAGLSPLASLYVDNSNIISNYCSECGKNFLLEQHDFHCSFNTCSECGNHVSNHSYSCSKYPRLFAALGNDSNFLFDDIASIPTTSGSISSLYGFTCSECGKKYLSEGHDYFCSLNTCSECGNPVSNHLSSCSQYLSSFVAADLSSLSTIYDPACSECGEKYLSDGHGYFCSLNTCSECGNPVSSHSSSCSRYVSSLFAADLSSLSTIYDPTCSECGNPVSNHLPSCSQYVSPFIATGLSALTDLYDPVCIECGKNIIAEGHEYFCSLSICSECGNPVSNHLSSCSQYVSPYIATDLGNIAASHVYISCSECGKKYFTEGHDYNCSFNTCSECGNHVSKHRWTCSHFRPFWKFWE